VVRSAVLLAGCLWPVAVAAQTSGLSGDWGGARGRLEDAGFTFGAVTTDEVLGNPDGSMRQGVVFDGNIQLNLTVDLDKALGWTGASFRASAYEIYGRGLSADNIGNLLTVNTTEATASTRLYDLYLEQSLYGGQASVRVGQFGADEEFTLSQYGALFLNSTFGWPGLPATDLPSGGPAYPLATPGVRVKAQFGDQWTVLAAVFNGNPAGPGAGNPQVRDASGTLFRVSDGVLAIAEAQYAINQGADATGLPGTYRVGGWYNSEEFADQHVDSQGLSLANPASNGEPRQHSGDFSVYAVADQMVWRKSGTKDGGVGVFARIMGAPSDRDLVNLYADAGVNWKGAIEGRADDSVGFGVAYARIGDAARALDADTAFYTATAYPIRSNETVLELTYQCQIAPWWQVQPDVQYIFNPGGGVLNPRQPGQRIGDAVVIGVQTVITF
jgi:porin